MSTFSALNYLNQADLRFIEGQPINPDHLETIVARYNSKTKILYILSSEIRELDDHSRAELKNSEQFIGCAAICFWANTGTANTKKGTQAVHVFDLNKPDRPRHDPQREERRAGYLKSLKRRYGDDYKTIAPLMERWDSNQINTKRRAKPAEESADTKALLQKIKRLEAMIRNPNTKTKTKTVQPKVKTKLPELDAYIERHREGIRTDITKKIMRDGIPQLYPRPKPSYLSFKDSPNAKLEYNLAKERYLEEYIDANGPTYNPSNQNQATYGLYKQTITLSATKPKRHYHLLAKTLKLEVPNYKDDIRFSHIQSTKIEYDKSIGSVRCAVFDWS
jgi:hypothetical protein